MKARRFLPLATFAGEELPKRYELLPFRFARIDARELLVSETGEWLFAEPGTAHALVRGSIGADTDLYRTLKTRHFLFDERASPMLDVIATKVRTKRAAAVAATSLHIFVVTLRCDHSCHYCQVSRQTEDKTQFDMSPEVAARAVETMLESPASRITMEFQGGEPLLAFDRITAAVELAESGARARGKDLEVVIVSNLAHLTDDMLDWMRDHDVMISTSLDGPAKVHDANRPRPGNDSHERAIRGIERVREALGPGRVAAIMTTTRLSLAHPVEIVDEYARLDLRSIFLRPLSPYGFAVRTRRRTGYATDAFIPFYEKAFERILALNAQGVPLQETYASLVLSKILTPFATGYVDLQSPAGAGLSVLVYNYDGDVYATDEARMLAEMKDQSFRLGNVIHDHRAQLFASGGMQTLLDGALNETLPGCDTCAFQGWCGADPVFHYTTQGDPMGNRPTSEFCRRHLHLFPLLFRHLAQEDPQTMRTFWSWVRGVSPAEMTLEAIACA